jgi:hypothetical protein
MEHLVGNSPLKTPAGRHVIWADNNAVVLSVSIVSVNSGPAALSAGTVLVVPTRYRYAIAVVLSALGPYAIPYVKVRCLRILTQIGVTSEDLVRAIASTWQLLRL